jgi:hypothetical protein
LAGTPRVPANSDSQIKSGKGCLASALAAAALAATATLAAAALVAAAARAALAAAAGFSALAAGFRRALGIILEIAAAGRAALAGDLALFILIHRSEALVAGSTLASTIILFGHDSRLPLSDYNCCLLKTVKAKRSVQ